MIAEADEKTIAEAARLLREGELVAFPTETVYGLGADATNGHAVARIFEAKGRPRFNPLIVHVPSLEGAQRFAIFDDDARTLALALWPGSLTLVLPKRLDASPPIASLVTAGLDTIAIRVPSHPIAQALLRAADIPIAAPSANISGRVSATTAAHVGADFGDKVPLILDSGPTQAGLESTIVALTPEPTLLRAGAVPREAIEALLGKHLAKPSGSAISSPGQLQSHYAPRARMRLNVEKARPGEVLLAFGKRAPEDALNLSRAGDLREAAANLFAYLRRLDADRPDTIAVMPIPEEGLGEAINDRLKRAAAPRT
jgi:L-threonylcarbamoyladenylate synthase